MNRLKKKAIILSIAGFIAGILIGIIISLLTASSEETPTNLWSRLIYLLAGGIHGAIAMGSSIIYEKEDWSIAGVTITHFVITLASFAVCMTLHFTGLVKLYQMITLIDALPRLLHLLDG